MSPSRRDDGRDHEETPIQAVARGAAAGVAAAVLLSGLSRVFPGLWNERGSERQEAGQALPQGPADLQQRPPEPVRSPAATPSVPGLSAAEAESPGAPPAAIPAGALTQPPAPGPEGLAEQFAFKVASGIFGRDISSHVRPIGMAVHLTYGSFWGVVYGIIQASTRLRPGLFGPLYGLAVYGIGPAFLVLAMKIMHPPLEEPAERTTMLLAGHIAYGTALAAVFGGLEPREE